MTTPPTRRANGAAPHDERPIRHGADELDRVQPAPREHVLQVARQPAAYVRPGRFTILTLIAENPGSARPRWGARVADISTLTPALDDPVRALVRRRA
jgi:hypothetical protein